MEKHTKSDEIRSLADHWSFPWTIMEVLIGGKSSIDLSALSIKSLEEAEIFLKSYGFYYKKENDRRAMHAGLVEALHFIEVFLMPKEWAKGKRPPKEVLDCVDPRNLLFWASMGEQSDEKEKALRQAWSCAILKVMHTISHLDDLQRLNNIHEARAQIIGRFQQALFRDKAGKLWFGRPECCIELAKIEWKPYKVRTSMILKLLHKPANVAETIFDLLGVRIITKKLSEAMLAVKFLRQFYLVDFANIHPSRSRNNLIDMDHFHLHLETLKRMLINKNITPEGFRQMVEHLDAPLDLRKGNNPHSSNQYRSIQLTCRQRVRYNDPNMGWQEKVAEFLKSNKLKPGQAEVLTQFGNFTKFWNDADKSKEISVFFPFEVQILDEKAALSIEHGDASHDKYKRAQVRTARRRVLSKVLTI